MSVWRSSCLSGINHDDKSWCNRQNLSIVKVHIKVIAKVVNWSSVLSLNIHHSFEIFLLKWNTSFSRKVRTRLKFITMMKIYHYDEIRHFEKNLSLWLKIISLKWVNYHDENSSLWWEFITMMKTYHDDKNPSLW